jgi:transposase
MAYRRRYPTDLSDAEWELVEPLIPPVKPGGRPAVHERREIAGALAYWLRERERVRLGREPTPSAAVVDSQMRRSWAPAGAPPRVVPCFAVLPRRWVFGCPRSDTHLTYMIDIALTKEFSLAVGAR